MGGAGERGESEQSGHCVQDKGGGTSRQHCPVLKRRWGKKNSLAVQWLGLGAFTAKGPGSIPGPGTEIPRAVAQPRQVGPKAPDLGSERDIPQNPAGLMPSKLYAHLSPGLGKVEMRRGRKGKGGGERGGRRRRRKA